MFMTRHYSSLINLCFITLLVYLGTHAFYETLSMQTDFRPHTVQLRPNGPSPLTPDSPQPLIDYKVVEKRNLFDRLDKLSPTSLPPQPAPAPDPVPPPTDLKLRLWGTVIGDPSQACAVIEDIREKKQNLYRQGDTVQGATIKQILREEVSLNVNGKDEKLTIAKGDRPTPLQCRLISYISSGQTLKRP